ncbi:MAG: hypothetical protein V3571_11995 [Pseudodesulfovibrio sp.]
MRHFLLSLSLLLLLCPTTSAGERTISQSSLPEQITFRDVTLHKAFEEAKDGAFITEYVPEGELLEHWFHLFAVRREQSGLSPSKRAAGIAVQLKKTNPEFRSQVLENKKTGDAGIDFLIWPQDDSYGEFNTWKFMQGEPGWLYSFQYGFRGYTGTPSEKALGPFMKQKQRTVMEMMRFELPAAQ